MSSMALPIYMAASKHRASSSFPQPSPSSNSTLICEIQDAKNSFPRAFDKHMSNHSAYHSATSSLHPVTEIAKRSDMGTSKALPPNAQLDHGRKEKLSGCATESTRNQATICNEIQPQRPSDVMNKSFRSRKSEASPASGTKNHKRGKSSRDGSHNAKSSMLRTQMTKPLWTTSKSAGRSAQAHTIHMHSCMCGIACFTGGDSKKSSPRGKRKSDSSREIPVSTLSPRKSGASEENLVSSRSSKKPASATVRSTSFRSSKKPAQASIKSMTSRSSKTLCERKNNKTGGSDDQKNNTSSAESIKEDASLTGSLVQVSKALSEIVPAALAITEDQDVEPGQSSSIHQGHVSAVEEKSCGEEKTLCKVRIEGDGKDFPGFIVKVCGKKRKS